MSPIDMLGWIGSVLVVVSLTQGNLRRLRTINLAASAIHLAFNLVIGLMPMIALNTVLTGINGYYLIADNHKTTTNPKRESRQSEEWLTRYGPTVPLVDTFRIS
jgi:hypothetical protein